MSGRVRASVLAIVALLVVCGPARAALPIERWTTSNGVDVLFVRADAVPMLDVNIDFDAGARHEPADKVGVASLTGTLLGKGAGELDEAAIAEGFARIGARRGAGAGDDRASLWLRTLTRADALDRAVDLFARIVMAPAFDAGVLARERARIAQSLRQSRVEPGTIAANAFARALYPAHPYGRELTPDAVLALTRDDVVAFHRARYTASGAVVSMIGAITREQARAIAERLVGALPRGEAPPPPPPVRELAAAVQLRIEHPASQSHILIGAPLMARGDPDYYALTIANYVLGGGGFVSRLYDEVREKRGLAYSVHSSMSPKLQPGPFTIGLQTERARTDEALAIVRATLERFVRDGPSDAEVAAAKANLAGGFALRIDSNRKILQSIAAIGYHRLPLDYLDRWVDRVGAVSTAQVADAVRRRLHPARMATVVVGAAGSP